MKTIDADKVLETFRRLGRALNSHQPTLAELDDRYKTQNEDNTMKYRVTTNVLSDFDFGDVIVRGSNGDQFVKEGQDIPGYPALMEEWIERNPDWFKKIEQVQSGQYWRFIKSGHVIRIDKIRNNKVEVRYINNDKYGQWLESEIIDRAEKLSTNEIGQALIKEAKRRGYHLQNKYGSVRYADFISIGGHGEVSFVHNDIDDILYVKGGRMLKTDIYCKGNWAEIVDQTPHIEINGYEAEFHEDYVQFGCAKIDKRFFTHIAEDDGDGWRETGRGNRKLESIKIGKGEFTINDIKQIAEYYE